jgi:putative flippase GtrA
VRFVIAGGAAAAVYILTTLALANGLGLPFEIALAIGFAAAICTHFTLQRIFVWGGADVFALGIRQQVTRYAFVAGVQYGVTAAATALLPSALGIPVTPVYIVTVAVVSALNFFVFRGLVFHAARDPE